MKNLVLFRQGVLKDKLQTSKHPYPIGILSVFWTHLQPQRKISVTSVLKWLKLAAVFLLIFTLGVGSAWGASKTYQKVTDYSTLSSSDNIVLVGYNNSSTNWYAMSNSQVTATNGSNLPTTVVTISNNAFTADMTGYIWHVETGGSVTINSVSQTYYYLKSDAGAYYLQGVSGKTGLKCTTKNATDNLNKWVLKYSDSKEISNVTHYVTGMYNVGASRLAAVYQGGSSPNYTYTWRNYASGNYNNISGALFEIYKETSGSSTTYTVLSMSMPQSKHNSLIPNNLNSPKI